MKGKFDAYVVLWYVIYVKWSRKLQFLTNLDTIK